MVATEDPVKPGKNTTEFWVTVALTVIGNLVAAYGLYKGSEPITAIGAVIVAVAGGTYNHSRGQAKGGKK